MRLIQPEVLPLAAVAEVAEAEVTLLRFPGSNTILTDSLKSASRAEVLFRRNRVSGCRFFRIIQSIRLIRPMPPIRSFQSIPPIRSIRSIRSVLIIRSTRAIRKGRRWWKPRPLHLSNRSNRRNRNNRNNRFRKVRIPGVAPRRKPRRLFRQPISSRLRRLLKC